MSMSLAEARELVGNFSEMAFATREPALVWPAMLDRLERAIGFDAGYIAASWGGAEEGRGAVAEYDPLLLRQSLGRYLSEISPAEVARYTDRAREHRDVWSMQRQAQLSVFRELLLPSHTKQLIVRVGVRRGSIAGFNLERRNATAFTERELQLVDLVAPFLHIVQVLTLPVQEGGPCAEFSHEYRLTKREGEFVDLAARGLQNSEIALLLNVSTNTVRNALARVFGKVGVSNRAELAYLATRLPLQSAARTPHTGATSDDWLRAFTALVQRASTIGAAEATNQAETTSQMPKSHIPRRVRYSAPQGLAGG